MFWRKKIKRHLEKGVLIRGVSQGLVKIFKKHVKVNHFLLLSYNLEKRFLVQRFFN